MSLNLPFHKRNTLLVLYEINSLVKNIFYVIVPLDLDSVWGVLNELNLKLLPLMLHKHLCRYFSAAASESVCL